MGALCRLGQLDGAQARPQAAAPGPRVPRGAAAQFEQAVVAAGVGRGEAQFAPLVLPWATSVQPAPLAQRRTDNPGNSANPLG